MQEEEQGGTAERLFASYLRRVEAGKEPGFDEWVGSHPAHERELRELHLDWVSMKDPRGAAGLMTASFFFHDDERERPEPAPGLEPGKVVGDFRLISLIGQGGMGQVWEAAQTSLGDRRVAIKFVRPDRVTPRQLELFQREARAGGRLSHSGIVSIHGYGETNGLAWIAMELVDGCWTLRDFLDATIQQGELPPDYDRHVAEFLAAAADALQAAHDASVIHRDLKPQNILVTSDDLPKITDFGLARIVDESALSKTGDFAGTYFYMSPEQVAARRAGIDHRSDIFSLGVVLYEMLTLRRPFEGDTTHQVAAQVLAKEPPDPRLIRSRIPKDLTVIAAKAMEKDPDRRYATMRELAQDLRRHLASEPIAARPPSRLDRGVRWVRRHKLPTIAGVLTLAVTALVPITTSSWLEKEHAERRRSELQEVASPSSEESRPAALLSIGERILAGESDAHDEFVFLTGCVEPQLLGPRTQLGTRLVLSLSFAPQDARALPAGLGIRATVQLRSSSAEISGPAPYLGGRPITGLITKHSRYATGVYFDAPYGMHEIVATFGCQLVRLDTDERPVEPGSISGLPTDERVVERLGSIVELPEYVWSGSTVPPTVTYPLQVDLEQLLGNEKIEASVGSQSSGRRSLHVSLPALPYRLPFSLNVENVSGLEAVAAECRQHLPDGSTATQATGFRLPVDLCWRPSGQLSFDHDGGEMTLLASAQGTQVRLEIILSLPPDASLDEGAAVILDGAPRFFHGDDPIVAFPEPLRLELH